MLVCALLQRGLRMKMWLVVSGVDDLFWRMRVLWAKCLITLLSGVLVSTAAAVSHADQLNRRPNASVNLSVTVAPRVAVQFGSNLSGFVRAGKGEATDGPLLISFFDPTLADVQITVTDDWNPVARLTTEAVAPSISLKANLIDQSSLREINLGSEGLPAQFHPAVSDLHSALELDVSSTKEIGNRLGNLSGVFQILVSAL